VLTRALDTESGPLAGVGGSYDFDFVFIITYSDGRDVATRSPGRFAAEAVNEPPLGVFQNFPTSMPATIVLPYDSSDLDN